MPRTHLLEERLTHSIIGAFFDTYNTLGYGYLESVYLAALERELRERGLRVAREIWVPVIYKGRELCRHRLDMVVADRVVVEAKSTQYLSPTASRQLFNYLRATRLELGLLLHFGPRPRVQRVVCRNAMLAEG